MDKCKKCKEQLTEHCSESSFMATVSFAAHEAALDRAERQTKRWMIAFFVALAMLFTAIVLKFPVSNEKEYIHDDSNEVISNESKYNYEGAYNSPES